MRKIKAVALIAIFATLAYLAPKAISQSPSTADSSAGAFAHLHGTSNAPSLAAGTGAGTSPTLAFATPGAAAPNSSDLAGQVTLTSGSGPSASAVVFTLTFANPYSAAPNVTLTPANANTAALDGAAAPYVSAVSATGFSVKVGSSALSGATAYAFNYLVAQ